MICFAANPAFELKDGDRVVTLGGTFIVRDGQFGPIEAVFTMAFPERKVTYRNLGWSGDTVWAESRDIFDPAHVGYARMIELVKELKPTLIVMAYGQNETFAEDAGRERFVQQYEKLCDDVDPNDPQFEHHRLEGLWMFQSHDVPNVLLLDAVLKSRKPHARAAGVRVIAQWFGVAGGASVEPKKSRSIRASVVIVRSCRR